MGFITENLPRFDNVAFGAVSGAVNYVARLDGVSQYWQLTAPININIDYTVELMFVGGVISNQYARFYCLTNNDMSVDSGIDSDKFRASGGVTSLNGNNIFTGEPIPTSGNNKIETKLSVTGVIDSIGSFNGTRLINLPLYGFIIKDETGTIINEIPLTNKAQGATQLATVGNINAFMANYTPDVWEVDNANN